VPALYAPASATPHTLRPGALAARLALALSAAHALLAHAQEAAPAPPQQPASAVPTTVLPVVKAKAKADTSTEGTGRYGARATGASTKLELSPRETPQSISVVTRTQIDDFALTDVNDLLSSVTGVNVERVEPDRSYFSVRGFEVSNFQIDGLGQPFATGDQLGNLDTALYDRVEVLRGANGLMSSTGNPSATVNFVRKRPTTEFRASGALSAGSWNRRRVDADVSGALNAEGSVRGRVTAAAQEGDSYLDRYSLRKHLFSGIVEVDLAPETTLTLGHTEQHNRPKGVMWGALPLYYSDGTPTRYASSASSAPSWSYWNNDDAQTFAELSQRLAGGWKAKATVTRRVLSSDAELFFVSGTPNPADGTGLSTWPSKYDHQEKQWLADAYASGPFTLGGRAHELVLGANWSQSDNRLNSSDDGARVDGSFTEAEMLAGNVPRPAFDKGLTGSADFHNRRVSGYGAARLSLSDAWHAVVGANATRATSRGLQYGLVHDYRSTKLTPFAGATWDFHPQHSLYGSYGRIYNPQYQTDTSGNLLGPIEGSNAELGVKGEWLDGQLNGSFAVFQVRQDNTPESAGFINGQTRYRGIDATSTGFELDVAGTLAPGWEASGGYTRLRIENPGGTAVRTHVPRQTLRLNTSYRLPVLTALKLGASVKWQSDYERTDGAVVTRQAAYALLDLAATYEITRQVSLTAKLENATDEKYLNSLMWPSQSFYGAPRNATVALKWTY
jgi:outer-membrane receptor for ferric coprogen and ferric-rhodotorulic acid